MMDLQNKNTEPLNLEVACKEKNKKKRAFKYQYQD